MAVRAMEEKVTFSRQMAEQMRNYNLTSAVTKYEDHAMNFDKNPKPLFLPTFINLGVSLRIFD